MSVSLPESLSLLPAFSFNLGDLLTLGESLLSRFFITIPSPPVGGVPLLDPLPRGVFVDGVRDGSGVFVPPVVPGVVIDPKEAGGRSQNIIFPHQVLWRSIYSFSSRLRSKADRYRS